jgi:aldehyde dehydrogenase (NAD+)
VCAPCLFGAVGTAGQRCTTTRRLFLQRGIAAKMTAALVNAYRQVKIGDPMEEGTLMGPLVNRRAVDDMMDGIGRIREQGGEILYGGETHGRDATCSPRWCARGRTCRF